MAVKENGNRVSNVTERKATGAHYMATKRYLSKDWYKFRFGASRLKALMRAKEMK